VTLTEQTAGGLSVTKPLTIEVTLGACAGCCGDTERMLLSGELHVTVCEEARASIFLLMKRPEGTTAVAHCQ
jgi:hypothetical protein